MPRNELGSLAAIVAEYRSYGKAGVGGRGHATRLSPEAGLVRPAEGNPRADGVALAFAQMRAPDCRSAARLLRTIGESTGLAGVDYRNC